MMRSAALWPLRALWRVAWWWLAGCARAAVFVAFTIGLVLVLALAYASSGAA